MRRIAAAKRAASAPEVGSPPSKPKRPAPEGFHGSRSDRLGRALDLERRKNLVEQRETVLTDASGAVAVDQMKTLVQLMGQATATPSESRAILLTLGRTAQLAPERLKDFLACGGLGSLAVWLKAAAPTAQSDEQRAVAMGCLRIMAKLPVSQVVLQRSEAIPVVKEMSQRFSWLQRDVDALLKQWYATLLKDQQTNKQKPPGLRLAESTQSHTPKTVKPATQPPPSSSSSSEGEEVQDSGAAAARGPGAAGQSGAQEAPRSRFEPRRPDLGPEAKRRRLGDSRLDNAESQAAAERDAEVDALLNQLESLNDLLMPE